MDPVWRGAKGGKNSAQKRTLNQLPRLPGRKLTTPTLSPSSTTTPHNRRLDLHHVVTSPIPGPLQTSLDLCCLATCVRSQNLNPTRRGYLIDNSTPNPTRRRPERKQLLLATQSPAHPSSRLRAYRRA